MKIAFLICLTALAITCIICRTMLALDYQHTAQILDHLDGLSSHPQFRDAPEPNDHL